MPKDIYIVYQTTCLVNDKTYIGIHKSVEGDGYLGSGTAISRDIKKYGRDQFKREILRNLKILQSTS